MSLRRASAVSLAVHYIGTEARSREIYFTVWFNTNSQNFDLS